MVNNHGDRKSPIPGVVPLQLFFLAHKLGITTYLLTGMILQVVGDPTPPKTNEYPLSFQRGKPFELQKNSG